MYIKCIEFVVFINEINFNGFNLPDLSCYNLGSIEMRVSLSSQTRSVICDWVRAFLIVTCFDGLAIDRMRIANIFEFGDHATLPAGEKFLWLKFKFTLSALEMNGIYRQQHTLVRALLEWAKSISIGDPFSI